MTKERIYRTKAGLTQGMVARRCGGLGEAVSRLEKEIPLSFLLLCLKAIGITKGEFFSGSSLLFGGNLAKDLLNFSLEPFTLISFIQAIFPKCSEEPYWLIG